MNILQYQLVDGAILLIPDTHPVRVMRPGNPIRVGGQCEQWCEQNLRFLREVQDAADQLMAEEREEQARQMREVDAYARQAREQGKDQARKVFERALINAGLPGPLSSDTKALPP